MKELQKVTVEYDENEDRIRLAGEDRDGSRSVMWLTQRLLRRLLPALIDWLGKKSLTSGLAEAILEFEHHAALAALQPQPPVPIGGGDTLWLIQVIDLKMADDLVALEFRGVPPGHEARFTVDSTAMRQWLSIVHMQCVRAEWPLDLWPRWMDVQDRDIPITNPLPN
jgi:hypothetical protein